MLSTTKAAYVEDIVNLTCPKTKLSKLVCCSGFKDVSVGFYRYIGKMMLFDKYFFNCVETTNYRWVFVVKTKQ